MTKATSGGNIQGIILTFSPLLDRQFISRYKNLKKKFMSSEGTKLLIIDKYSAVTGKRKRVFCFNKARPYL